MIFDDKNKPQPPSDSEFTFKDVWFFIIVFILVVLGLGSVYPEALKER